MSELELVFLLVRTVVAVAFIYHGISKLVAPVGFFAGSIAKYRLIPSSAINTVATILPIVETVIGLSLLFNIASTISSLILLVLLLIFQVALGSLLIRGLKVGCGCSSNIGKDSPKQAFIRNWLLIVLLIISSLAPVNIVYSSFFISTIQFTALALTLLAVAIQFWRSIEKSQISIGNESVEQKPTLPVASRRQFITRLGATVVGALVLSVIKPESNALACTVPADCSCGCRDYYTTLPPDCNSYCGPGRWYSGCKAPIYEQFYYVCCNYPGLQCSDSPGVTRIGDQTCPSPY